MDKILISRCLLGDPVRYDAQGRTLDHFLLRRWRQQGRLVALCPELAGGLPCPRPAAEIQGGQGGAVITGRARVLTAQGADVSQAFIAGAAAALARCQTQGIRFALLKARSPSCGSRDSYDGSFGARVVAGAGVTAALLQRHGIACFDETQLAELAARLDR